MPELGTFFTSAKRFTSARASSCDTKHADATCRHDSGFVDKKSTASRSESWSILFVTFDHNFTVVIVLFYANTATTQQFKQRQKAYHNFNLTSGRRNHVLKAHGRLCLQRPRQLFNALLDGLHPLDRRLLEC